MDGRRLAVLNHLQHSDGLVVSLEVDWGTDVLDVVVALFVYMERRRHWGYLSY
jgi:hypothetical protein